MSGLAYLDGSNHAHWKEHVDVAPAFEAELLAAGFTPLGLLVAVPSDGGTVGSELFEGDDQALLAAQERGTATRVFLAPDRRTFAVPSSYFGGPVVTLRSLRADGFIVETVTAPARAPDVAPQGLTDRLLPRHVWPRPHAPRAGQSVVLAPGPLAAVLAAHEAHASRLGDVRPVDDMDAVVQSFARSFAVSERVTLLVLRWTVFGLVAGGLVLVGAPIVACAGLWGRSPWLGVAGGLLAPFVVWRVVWDVVPPVAERLAWRLAGHLDLPASDPEGG